MKIESNLKKHKINPANKTTYRNFPMVPKVIFGAGSFSQLGDILLPMRKSSEAPFIFMVDDFFENEQFLAKVPLMFNDEVIFISAEEEPKTAQVDALVAQIREKYSELPSGIIGIGGGTLLDLAKAVSILLNNKGLAKDYQGWDLVNKPALLISTSIGSSRILSSTIAILGS